MGHLSDAVLGFSTVDEAPPSPVTVGTDAVQLLESNPNRLQAVFSNPGGTTVYVSTRANIGVDEGFPVPSGNGTLTLNVTEDGDLPQREWYGIVGSGTQDVSVQAEVAEGDLRDIGPEDDG